MSKPTISTGIIIEQRHGLADSRTGGTQSLTKVFTLDGDIVSIWTATKPTFKANDEVTLVTETEEREDDTGADVVYTNTYMVPTAFAAKLTA